VTTRFLIRNRHAKYLTGFDAVFFSEDVQVLQTPYRSPNANAFGERFVGTMRRGCLDHLLIVNERQLKRMLRTSARHYNG